MIKNEYFTNMAVGTEFVNCGTGYRKVSARKALNLTDNREVMVRAHMMGEVTYPDPTPEERAALRLRILNYKLAEMIEAGAAAQDDLVRAMAKDHGWFNVFTSSGAIENQMRAAAQLHVGTRALGILNHAEGGIEKLTSEAMRNAMRYATYGSHSTSAVSNVAEEMQAATWAQVAEACGWDRN